MKESKLFAMVAGWIVPLAVLAMANPPYEVYPYLADAGDDPPLNYMKVCEPPVAVFGRLDACRPRPRQGLQILQGDCRDEVMIANRE